MWGAPPPGGPGVPNGDSVIPPIPVAPGDTSALGGTGLNQALTPVTFEFNYLAAATLNKVFPLFTRMATQSFSLPVALCNIDLSTSMANLNATAICSIIVAKDQGPTLNVNGNTTVYVCHIVTAGSSHSMRSGVSFADDVAPRLGSSEQVALYASSVPQGGGGSDNYLTAVCTIRYFQV